MSGEGRPRGASVDAAGLSLAIAATRWHAEITDSLVRRAVAAAAACGISEPLGVRAPGAVELPVAAAELAATHDAGACPGAGIPCGAPRLDQTRGTDTRRLTPGARRARTAGGNRRGDMCRAGVGPGTLGARRQP